MLRVSTSRLGSLAAAARPAAALRPVAARRSAHHDSHAADGETYPEEGFHAPFWRTGSLVVVAGFVFYTVSPKFAAKVDHLAEPTEGKPYLTRMIEDKIMPAENLWKSRNEKHLELAKEAAEAKLLFQEAERPKVRRLRYTGTFEQASPNAVPIGSQADLSDLVIKSEKDDFKVEA